MNVQIMVVPGPILDVTVPDGGTVMDVAVKAEEIKPEVEWVALTGGREVRVNKKMFSNVAEIDPDKGYVGSIKTTPLCNGDVILIITKIKGNDGSGVLTCTVNGQDYALETPDTIANILRDVVGIDPDSVISVTVDEEDANLQDLVGNGDEIDVELSTDQDELLAILVNGIAFPVDEAGKLAAIAEILAL
ncbi:MAG: hypothetical protein Q7K65_03670 [Candidatus Buchananbacteria bacterium]|nr:hypothetical protein [Candidatus Buchananbacteria bacterium]